MESTPRSGGKSTPANSPKMSHSGTSSRATSKFFLPFCRARRTPQQRPGYYGPALGCTCSKYASRNGWDLLKSTECFSGSASKVRAGRKQVHTLIFLFVSACILYVIYCRAVGKTNRRLWASVGIVFLIGLMYASNGFECPLSTLVHWLAGRRDAYVLLHSTGLANRPVAPRS